MLNHILLVVQSYQKKTLEMEKCQLKRDLLSKASC